MTHSGLQKTWVRILLTVMTAAMMALIFFFSTEPAEKSDATSGGISRAIINVAYPQFDSYPQERQKEIFDSVQFPVRKAAHFTEYLVLGALLRLCLESWLGKRRFLLPAAWAGGTLYACTDELHQMLIDGRSGQWTDVLLDSCGVLAGVLLVTLILGRLQKKGKDR